MDSLIDELVTYIKKLIKDGEATEVAQNVKALADLMTAKTCCDQPSYLPLESSREQMDV